MKYNSFLGVLVLLSALACSKEARQEIPPIEKTAQTITLSAKIPVTKTGLHGESQVWWRPGDKIWVYRNGESAMFSSTITTESPESDFVGELAAGEGPFIAVYPYLSSKNPVGEDLQTSVPSIQRGVPGTFEDNLMVSVAWSETQDLVFHHFTSGLRFSLTRDDITQIRLQATDGAILAAPKVFFKDQTQEYFVRGSIMNTPLEEGYSVVSLFPKEGETFVSGEWYYFITLPASCTQGITLTFYTKDGKMGTFRKDEALMFERGTFKQAPQVDKEVAFTSQVPAESNQIHYLTTDGAIVTPAGMTPVSNVYENGLGVMSFDQPVTSIPQDAFSSNETLLEIYLPGSIKTIGQKAFSSCRNLRKAVLQEGVTVLDKGCFLSCLSLESMYIPGSVESIGLDAFQSCVSLGFFSGPLSRENGQLLINNGEVIAIAVGYTDCKIPEGVHTVREYACCGMGDERLQRLTLPEGLTTIQRSAFAGFDCVRELVIPSTVTYLGGSCLPFRYFRKIEGIWFKPKTPPVMGGTVLFNYRVVEGLFYVPKRSVEAYKAAWPIYADRIVGYDFGSDTGSSQEDLEYEEWILD